MYKLSISNKSELASLSLSLSLSLCISFEIEGILSSSDADKGVIASQVSMVRLVSMLKQFFPFMWIGEPNTCCCDLLSLSCFSLLIKRSLLLFSCFDLLLMMLVVKQEQLQPMLERNPFLLALLSCCWLLGSARSRALRLFQLDWERMLRAAVRGGCSFTAAGASFLSCCCC